MGAFFALVIAVSFRKIDAMDVAYQMKFADLVLHGRVPQTEPFTFSAVGHPYICLNLVFDVVAWSLFQAGSFEALSLYLPVTVLVIFGLLLYGGRKLFLHKTRPWLWLALLTLAAIEYRFGVCSEELALIYLLLMIADCESFRLTQNQKWLYFLPLIQVFWVNTQATFVIGWLVVGAYFLTDWWSKKKWNWKYALTCLAVVGVSLLNLYGWRGAIFPLQSFSWFQESDYFNQTISEYYNLPRFWDSLMIFSYQPSVHLAMRALVIYFVMVTVVYVTRARVVKIHEWLIYGVLALLTYQSNRVAPFFVLGTFWSAGKLMNLPVDRPKVFLSWWRALLVWLQQYRARLITDFLFLIIVIIYAQAAICGIYYGIEVARFGWGRQETYVPYPAVEFIKKSGLRGKILNEYIAGGWLAYGQDNPVFIMGHLEVMGEKLYQEAETLEVQGQVKPLIDKYQPTMIFYRVSREKPYIDIYQNVLKLPNWSLVYADESAFVFAEAEATKAAQVQAFDWDKLIKERNFKTQWSDQEIQTLVNKEYKHGELTTMYKFIDNYGVWSKWAYYLNMTGDYQRSTIIMLNYLQASPDYDEKMYFVLQDNYLQQGDYERAAWIQKVLRRRARRN